MQAWIFFLKKQEKKFGKEIVDKWLRSLKVIKFDACNLYLEAKDLFQINWFQEYIKPIIQNQLINNNGHKIKIHITTNTFANTTNKKLETTEEIYKFEEDHINSQCSFDKFLVNEKNEFAFKLLKNKTDFYNPIFLYGPTGCGKTHLLMSIAYKLKQKNMKTLFIKSTTFAEHVVKAFRSSLIKEFRNFYRYIDVLCIDDIHFFDKKKATQEEFFHTFNTLYSKKSQIIITSNTAPSKLKNIEERLISRFEWGVPVSIKQYEKEELEKILEKHEELLHLNLPKELKTFLINNFKNAKLLIRTLKNIVKSQIPIQNTQLITHKLKKLIYFNQKKENLHNVILEKTSNFFKIETESIKGKSQKKEHVIPRQIAMYLLRTELNMTYNKIAQIFSKDHSTIISSVKKIKENQKIKPSILEIRNSLT